MPTMILPANGNVTYISGEWDANTGHSYAAVFSNDGDTTYIEEGDDNNRIEFAFLNPTVHHSLINKIESIQLLTYGKLPVRTGGQGRVDFQFKNFPSDVVTEAIIYPNNSGYKSMNGGIKDENSSSSDITYSNLNVSQKNL